MNISHQVKAITPRVKDHRGYIDMIFDLSVFIDYTDDETNYHNRLLLHWHLASIIF